jgi:multicomponent Na+:H+ antiporter subunit E
VVRFRTIILLTLFYLGLTANLEWLNILVGLLVATGVSYMLPLQGGMMAWRSNLEVAWALLRYVLLLAYDLIKSGFQVAWIVLNPKLPIRPGIAALDSGFKTDLGAALNAHAITLAPGELVLEMDEQGVLYTHCLDATRSSAYIQQAQEMRRNLLDKIFQ